MSIEPLVNAAWEDATAPGAILLVSDNPAGSSDLRELLGRHGYEVIAAHGVREAVPAMARVRPDLVLVDVDLRDGDALAFAASVRREFPGVALVVIAPQRRGVAERVRAVHAPGTLPGSPGDQDTLRLVGRLMHERLGPYRDLSAAPRRAEEIEPGTELPARLRVALVPANTARIRSTRRDLSRRGILFREVRAPRSAEGEDVVFELRVSVGQALELGWQPAELRSALVEAFPWLGSDPSGVDLRLRALRDRLSPRKVG